MNQLHIFQRNRLGDGQEDHLTHTGYMFSADENKQPLFPYTALTDWFV